MIYQLVATFLFVLFAVWLFVRHQRKLKRRAWVMQEAVRNRDFQFRLSLRGLFFGERAMQETLNNLGQEIRQLIAANEVESWQKLTRVLTHEIMNATAPIVSISQTFLTRPDVQGTELEEGIRAIRDTSTSLNTFVENYRKFTQLQKPQPSLVSLRALAESLVPLFPNLSWQIEISEKATIETDEGLLRQVIVNLAKNAQEAGARRFALSFCDEANSKNHRPPTNSTFQPFKMLSVSNDGAPIPAEIRRDIFTPFFTTKHTGSGIGLSLSRQIMVMQGGSLSLAEKPASGYHATFLVAFTYL